ncbi:hypothetical protein WJX75_004688 [Coccomyxa subellipsoidea]|uniref:WD40 repeat-like protein n=1 Tax=Coccomyxa subellipsoidea TaxID=248742 RepID=A0ABR2YS60_9CHLO
MGDIPMPDAKPVGSSGTQRSVTAPSYSLQYTLKGHTLGVVSVKFSHNGAYLATASADKTAKLWDIFTGKCLHTLEGHTKGLCDISWEHRDRYVATASDDHTVKLWEVTSGECLRTLEGHTHYVFCCAFNPLKPILVSGSFDETVKIWDVTNGDCLKTLPAHSDPVTAVHFNRDGSLIVSASYDGLIRIWDSADGKCLRTIMMDSHPPISHVRFSPNGRYVLTASLDHKIKLWDYDKQKELKVYTGHKNAQHCIFAAFSVSDTKGKWVISGSEDSSICIWHLNSKQLVQQLQGRPDENAPGDGHCDTVLAVDAHPKMSVIASGALEKDKTVKIWADTTDPTVGATRFEEARRNIAAAAPEPAPPPEQVLANGTSAEAQSSSTGSSARRILFNNKKHREQPDAAVLQGEEYDEVESRTRLCPPLPSGACPMSEAGRLPSSGQLRAAAASLFGHMPKAQQMGEYFQAAEQQVRQRFQERWSVDAHTGRPVESGRWQCNVHDGLP